jgi:hypothetical protein
MTKDPREKLIVHISLSLSKKESLFVYLKLETKFCSGDIYYEVILATPLLIDKFK